MSHQSVWSGMPCRAVPRSPQMAQQAQGGSLIRMIMLDVRWTMLFHFCTFYRPPRVNKGSAAYLLFRLVLPLLQAAWYVVEWGSNGPTYDKSWLWWFESPSKISFIMYLACPCPWSDTGNSEACANYPHVLRLIEALLRLRKKQGYTEGKQSSTNKNKIYIKGNMVL